MNKITTTAGLLALGAASVQAAVYAPPPGSPGATKPWSISAALRGFYDDNYTTSGRELRRDSFGFEVSPSAGLNLIRDQTAIGLNYVYSMRYYEDRDNNRADHAHQVNAKLSHAFTPRYKFDITDSFVIAQEPEVLDPSAVRTLPLRSNGDNLRNVVTASFSAGVTETTDLVFGYSNSYYDYEQEGLNSYSAMLDRVEHLGSINLRQVILERTVGVVGYQFRLVDYNSPHGFGSPFIPGGIFDSDARDKYSHIIQVGVDQGITATLNASIRVGAQYTKYDELDRYVPGADDDEWNPYVDANATWVYLPGSYAQLGVRHGRSETDVALIPTHGGTYAVNPDAESTTVYGSVSHRIFGALVASLIGQYQHSSYESGASDTDENLFLAGVNLTYEINRWVSAEAGYNYDRLDSDLNALGVDRSFTRNRVYVGVRATY